MTLNLKGEKVDYIISSGCGGIFDEGFGLEYYLNKLKLSRRKHFVYETKTVTLEPRVGNWNGNPWHCIRPIFGRPYGINGLINAIGLTNPGYEVWKEQFKYEIAKDPYKRWIVSIYGTQEELKIMVEDLDKWFSNFIIAININVSCPNTTDGSLLYVSDFLVSACKELKELTNIPLILKISVIHNFKEIIPDLKGCVDVIAINSTPWNYQFGYKAKINNWIEYLSQNKRCSHTLVPFKLPKSPLAHFGNGGISGHAAQKYTWPMIEKIKQISDIPVIGCNVWGRNDIEKLWKMGVSAISFGAIYLLGTSLLANYYVEKYNKEKAYKEYLEEIHYRKKE
jgi:dihydroorotate dehydrogenase